MCLVVLMLFFSDSSDEQALGFSACYNRVGTFQKTPLIVNNENNFKVVVYLYPKHLRVAKDYHGLSKKLSH